MLAELGVTDPDYIERSAAQWASDSCYTWAVCEPTTGEMLAEVKLDPATGEIRTRTRATHDQPAAAGSASVRRFAMTLPSNPQ